MSPISTTVRAVAMLACLASPVRAQLGYLGPPGTFSEEAAETYLGTAPDVGELVAFETMTAVVEALRSGRIARGILPVASTVAGFPGESSRLLLGSRDPGFRVVSELVLGIELHLMVQPGTPRELVQRIASHPNALGEARAFLDAHYPGVAREETRSTAAAAERVKSGDGTLAAVASAAAARLYGLEILDRAIQEDPHNATSFWGLARPGDAPAVTEATHLVLLVDAAPGSDVLSETIARLHEAELEIVFVESTPLPGPLFGFRYLVSLRAAAPVPADRVERAILGRALRLGFF